jgi:hypothetical protein
MPGIRDIITHVEVQMASAVRICHHNRREHRILKGQKCLAVHAPDGSRRNYCLGCALEIIGKAKAKLAALEGEISL